MARPIITVQPQPLTVYVGQDANFHVGATSDDGPITEQWWESKTTSNPIGDVPGDTSGTATDTLTVAGATATAAAGYFCRLTNNAGYVESTTAKLTVLPVPAPEITTQPAPVTVAAGGRATFTVVAKVVFGGLRYQWSKGSKPIAGATAATYTIPSAASADAGGYSVVVTSDSGASVTSTSVALTVTVPGGTVTPPVTPPTTGGGTGAPPTTGGSGNGGVGTTTPGVLWTLGTAGGPVQTTAALGVSEISRSRASQTTDTCEITFDGRNVDAGALFSFAATVTIYRGDTPWFSGRVNSQPGSGNGSRQSQSVTLHGPWWYLEHLVFTQTWTTKAGTATAQIGRAILGQALDGSMVATGAVITEALNYAIGAGAPFALGSILPGFTFGFDQVKDVTCAEVVRKMLHWHPDAVAWFDYRTLVPTLNIVPRAQLAAVTLTKGLAPLESIGQITSRDDLLAPEVVIVYEITGKNNASAYTDVSIDAAPPGATGKKFGAVVLTIPLRGESSTSVNSPVIVTPIVDVLDDDGLVPFLVAQYGGELATANDDPNIGAAGITITKIDRALKDPDAVEYDPSDPDGDPVPVEYDDSLSNMLLSGSITEAMKSTFALKAQEHRITFSYTLDSGSGDSDGPSGSDYQGVSDERTGTLDFFATNAVTSPYTTETSYDGGDTAPTGLAANYLAALNVLQWSGSVVLVEQTAGATTGAGLGNTLNIAGSENGAWASMGALIVQEQVQVFAGRTTLTCGPSSHLGPKEMIARLQTARPGGLGGRESTGGKSTADSGSRVSGDPGSQNTVGLGTAHGYRNSVPVPPPASKGGAGTMPFDVIAPDDPGKTSTVYGQVNTFSLFLADEDASDTTDATGLGEDVSLSDGMIFYLQVDATDDGSGIQAVSVVNDTMGFGDKRIKIAGSGTDSDPFIWDQSFYPIAQVFASSGTPTHGGTVFKSGDGTASLEVVNLCSSHLALVPVVVNGVLARGVAKTAAAFG